MEPTKGKRPLPRAAQRGAPARPASRAVRPARRPERLAERAERLGRVNGHEVKGQVLTLTPERVLHTVSKRFLDAAPDRCPKCGSTFVGREPAFLHCYYCGKMARIAGGSLADQELFELRAGLRLAS